MASFAKQIFAPEVRRVLQFFKGFFPKFPHREVDIYQTPAITPYQAKSAPDEETVTQQFKSKRLQSLRQGVPLS